MAALEQQTTWHDGPTLDHDHQKHKATTSGARRTANGVEAIPLAKLKRFQE